MEEVSKWEEWDMNSEKCDRLNNGVIVPECGPAQPYEGGESVKTGAQPKKKKCEVPNGQKSLADFFVAKRLINLEPDEIDSEAMGFKRTACPVDKAPWC